MNKTVLVTGGAGYIGSALAKKLLDFGHKVIVIDNLSRGRYEYVDQRATFYHGDLSDFDFTLNIFKKHKFEAVFHLAGYKDIGESMVYPELYTVNIITTLNILKAMVETGVKQIIFSSTATLYGEPQYYPIDENHPLNPLNYYGFSKFASEKNIQWFSQIKGIKYCIFRYFNLVGNLPGLDYIDPASKNLFPILMENISGWRETVKIFGTDYPTPDGTCVRDYIDLEDLVIPHIQALDLESSQIINLGTSTGYSVKECLNLVAEVTGKKVNCEYVERRPGDPSHLLTSNQKAKNVLNWSPKISLAESIKKMFFVYSKYKTMPSYLEKEKAFRTFSLNKLVKNYLKFF